MYALPDGSLVHLATAYDSVKTISQLTNANPAVATITAHGYSDGDYVEVTSGWQRLNQRILRADNPATNTIELEGFDTTDTTVFTPGGGIGSAKKITTWTELPQILGFQTQGGDLQFANFSFLAEDFERQLPTVYSAMSLQIQMADDPSQAGIIAAAAAAEKRAVRAVRLSLPNGSKLLFNGIVSYNPTPTLTKGQIMAVTMNLSLQGRPIRYAS